MSKDRKKETAQHQQDHDAFFRGILSLPQKEL